jgi:hypothetical protein
LEDRERKRRIVADLVSQQAVGEKKPTKRLSRAVGSAIEAAQIVSVLHTIMAGNSLGRAPRQRVQVLGARKLSKRINYEALGDAVDGMFDAKPATTSSVPPAAAPPQVVITAVAAGEKHAKLKLEAPLKPVDVKKRSATHDQPTKILRPGAASAFIAAEAVEPEGEEQEFVAEMGYGGAAGATGVDDYDYTGYDDND